MSDKKSSKRKTNADGNGDESKEESPKKLKTESTDNKNKNDISLIKQVTESRKKLCDSVAEFKFNKKRVRILSKAKDFPDGTNGVVYWMSRDQRIQGEVIVSLCRTFIRIVKLT